MKFGVCLANFGESSSVEGISAVALEAERLGYDSVWTTDHVLMSKDSGTPYERIFDSIATLAYLAPQTRKVKLGISCLIIAMRNPAAVAKQLASIDAFSAGRVMLGVGVGWNEKEFMTVGSDFQDRGKRVDDSIRMLKSLWRGDPAFSGRALRVSYDDAVFDPKPVSKELVVWIGGTSDAAMRRAVRLGDAWHPNVSPMESFVPMVEKFRGISKETPICVRISIDLRAKEAEYSGPQGDRRVRLTGDMKVNEKVISQLEDLGVSYAILGTSPEGKTPTSEQLESIRAFADRFVR